MSFLLAGAGERTEDVISRALFYDLLDKAEVHNTYKDLLTSVAGPEKSMKSASRIILEKSKSPSSSLVKFYLISSR